MFCSIVFLVLVLVFVFLRGTFLPPRVTWVHPSSLLGWSLVSGFGYSSGGIIIVVAVAAVVVVVVVVDVDGNDVDDFGLVVF